MTNDRLRFLFNRYVSKTLSKDERKEFFKLLSKSESNENLKELLDQLWESLPEENVYEPIPEGLFHNVVQQAHPVEKANSRQKSPWIKVAAAIGFAIMTTLGLYFYSSTTLDQTISLPIASSEAHTSFIRLPDGSSVVLNDKSTLKYPDSFDNHSTREVFLEGEAYFDIKHHPSKPFIVRSENVSTTVLGTAFNIKAFPADKNIVVTVTRGKVEVSANKRVLGVITRDQQLMVDKKSVATDQHVVNSQQVIAWMERDIVFNDITMEEAMQELENRFNVKIDLTNDQLRKCRFTATFINGEDLDQILIVICEFNKASFQRKESSRIEIVGTGCQ